MLDTQAHQVFQPTDIYGDTQRVATILTRFTSAILIGLVVGVAAALSNHDVWLAVIVAVSIPPALFTFFFISRQKFEWAAVFLSLIMFVMLTVAATTSLGIHNISNMGFPALLILASMVTRKRTMVFLTLCAVGCAAWLCFGELSGAFTPQTLVRSVPGDFITTAMLIILTGFMSRFLSENLFQINAQLRQELIERKRAEEEIQQLNANLEQRVEERTRELREAQEQIVRQEKLAIMGQLAGSMGHELLNPLGVISNAVYFLKMTQPAAGGKAQDYLELIEKQIRISDKIVTDLLDFTRVKPIERVSTSIQELIRQSLYRFPAPDSIKVTLDLPADLPKAYVSPKYVVQILDNLILNAYQSMEERGGSLTISSRAQDDLICIVVQDTGIGIPAENLEKIFEPLFSTKLKGIGLGLAVSKKLAEANEGRIEVQSAAGAGSTFTLWLPKSPNVL